MLYTSMCVIGPPRLWNPMCVIKRHAIYRHVPDQAPRYVLPYGRSSPTLYTTMCRIRPHTTTCLIGPTIYTTSCVIGADAIHHHECDWVDGTHHAEANEE